MRRGRSPARGARLSTKEQQANGDPSTYIRYRVRPRSRPVTGRSADMSSVTPLIRWPVLIALVTLLLVVVPLGVSTSAESSITPKAPVTPAPAAGRSAAIGQPAPGPVATVPGDDARPVFGIAQPGGSIPRATGPNGATAWQDLSDQLHESGVCWLRTDMTPRLADAIRTFGWLGGPGRAARPADRRSRSSPSSTIRRCGRPSGSARR